MSQDLYSRLHELDQPTLQTIAEVLEVRGRHPQQVAIRAAYLDLLGDLDGLRVLDVGCGTGVVTREIARWVGGYGVTLGVDPTPEFVEFAVEADRRERAGATYQVADGRALRFPDASFDVVVAVTVLCHLPERKQVLREMVRVARPGGRLLIVDGDYASNQIGHPDTELTARLVDAWRASVVDDPHLMRRIVPMVERAGLELGAINGHVHVEAGSVDRQTSFIWQWALFAERQARLAGAITEAEGARWIEQLGELNARSELFGSVNYLSVLARKP